MITPLRVGLLVDSLHQPAWVHKIITDIQASSIAEIVLVVLNESGSFQSGSSPSGSGTQGPSPSFLHKLLRFRQDLLYILYRKLDERLFRLPLDAFRLVDLRPHLLGCPSLAVIPMQTAFSDTLQPQDEQAILEYRLDVALRFGFRILRGRFLNIAKFGVWSYHHGDNLVNRGGPPGFWEVMEGNALTGSILQILSEKLDDGKVLTRSTSATHRHSVYRNRNNYYWKSSSFVLRKLRDLAERGPQALEEEPSACTYQPYSHRLYKQPQNLEMARLLGRWARRYTAARLANVFFNYQWFLAYQIGRSDGPAASLYRSKTILPPKDRFWADPFPVQKDGKYYIFIEEYLYRAGKGHISVIEMDEAGHWQSPRAVLERETHLSYPFVFLWQGHYYMIPETAGNRTIELYRCTSLPDHWQLEQVLMTDVIAADATLLETAGLWWMFVNLSLPGASKDDELHLFYADTPLGPWHSHPKNPIKSDVRASRPAGRIFRWNGCWVRPAQDCSETYGYAISLNQILCLDRERYEEVEVSRILPRWQPEMIATHTLNSAGGLTVVDALRKRRKLL